MVQRWPHATPVGALRNQVLGLHGIDRLALLRHKFNSCVYYCLIRESGEVLMFLGNYPVKIAVP
jgi:hypothetical protein